MLESEALKTDVSFDYLNSNILTLASFESEYGRFGIRITKIQNFDRDTFLSEISGKDIYPVDLGFIVAKKTKNISFGLSLFGYIFNEYLEDAVSPFNNTILNISDFNIHPSLSFDLTEMLLLDISGNISILSIEADDVNRIIKANSPIGFCINGKITQNLSENIISVSGLYSSKPYAYEEMSQGDVSGDIYYKGIDSLKVSILVGMKTFSYMKSYLSANYLQKTDTDKTIYNTGSESVEKNTLTKLPEITAGFSFYANKHLSINVGVSGAWYSEKSEQPPLLTPIVSTSGFETDFRTGVVFNIDNLSLAFDFSKNIFDGPYLLTGNPLGDIDLNFGISYSGYEY